MGATVAKDTLRVVTFQTEAAWHHACNGRQDMKFLVRQLVVVIVEAFIPVGALAQQEVIIAQLELFQAIEFVARNALEIEMINALAVFVSLYGLGRCRARYLGVRSRLETWGPCLIGGGSRQRPANTEAARIGGRSWQKRWIWERLAWRWREH